MQELGMLRQGSMSLLQYYDEVSKKLTLFPNKVNMPYEPVLARGLCEKFREDALRVFVSGLKRSLTHVLFSAKPRHWPIRPAKCRAANSRQCTRTNGVGPFAVKVCTANPGLPAGQGQNSYAKGANGAVAQIAQTTLKGILMPSILQGKISATRHQA